MPKLVVLNDPLDAREHNDLGVSYEKRGEYDLAEREYKRAAKLDEEWAKPLVNLGNVYAAQERWDKAREAYLEGLDRQPENTLAMNNLAWALVKLDENERRHLLGTQGGRGRAGRSLFLGHPGGGLPQRRTP